MREDREVQLITPPTVAARYANVVLIQYTQTEVVFTFAYRKPDATEAEVRDVVVLAPYNAKQMVSVLAQIIAALEAYYGPVPDAAPAGLLNRSHRKETG